MEVATKNNRKSEREVAEIIKELLSKYNIPIFTKKIMVESKVIPHSHPILTLNTRTRDSVELLRILVHEQFHWFAQSNPSYDEAIDCLKEHHEDNGECNVTGGHPNSFWEHIIVCFNTRKVLEELLSSDDLNHAYSVGYQYTKTEKLVKDNFNQIAEKLVKYNMVYTPF